MPRKRPRDDDFDDLDDDIEVYDEDGRPLRRRRRREAQNTGMPLWVFGGIGVGAVLVIVVVVFIARSKRAERDQEVVAARAEQERLIALNLAREAETRRRDVEPRPRPHDFPPPRVSGQNWGKVVGTWQRPAAHDGYPHSFDFRPDRSVTMTRVNFDGTPKSHEAVAEVHIDEAETLSLILHVQMGTYSYSFRVKPDGTLVLHDGKDGLVFARVK